MNTIIKNGARLAGVGAASAVALGFFSAGAANADTFVPLPNGSITQTLDDGTVVTVNRVGESANINPSLGSTGMHRNVWTTGTASVDIKGKFTKGRIQPGYVVGCQLTIGGNATGGAGLTGNAGVSVDNTGTATPSAGLNSNPNIGGGVTLGPGQAVNFPILDREAADDFGVDSHYDFNDFKGTHGSVSWSDASFGISGCAGYAQARNYITVQVYQPTATSKVTLWGQPFSIG